MPDREPQHPDPDGATRRAVLRGAALGGLTLPLLGACAGSQGSGGQAGGGEGSGSSQPAKSGTKLVAAGKVPVGGGTILSDAEIVVTQPRKGEFEAFSAICTHAGCLVGAVQGGAIICPCHGSRFSVKDGSVLQGPASRPLSPVKVTVKGGTVVKA